MQLYSTRNKNLLVSFENALLTGQAPDGGLFMPAVFPKIFTDTLKSFTNKPFKDIAFFIAQNFVGDEINEQDLSGIINSAYTFAPQLHQLDDKTEVLELFHGPTMSFKDFGAQFMAKSMGHFIKQENRELTILVATSGDTGSAVAHAYHNVEGIRVVLLYPSGKVSPLQEKQFTTMGGNITALEVDGTFDDCQALVKQAFSVKSLREKAKLTSANSINIGRLIPQSFYYFWSVIQLLSNTSDVNVCVPSGNFGNITAGLFAQKIGLPVHKFIAAVNANHVIPDFFDKKIYEPRPSVKTISNAMDVGNPSNWERICTLYHDSYETIQNHLWTTSIDDRATMGMMRQTKQTNNYIADPHTSVGLEAVKRYRSITNDSSSVITLSTAHPGKFYEIVEKVLDEKYDLPEKLANFFKKEKITQPTSKEFSQFKEFLWELA